MKAVTRSSKPTKKQLPSAVPNHLGVFLASWQLYCLQQYYFSSFSQLSATLFPVKESRGMIHKGNYRSHLTECLSAISIHLKLTAIFNRMVSPILLTFFL